MKIVDILRAKSGDEGNFLLKDHLKETIKQAALFREFINKNKTSIQYNFDDAFFKNLLIACFLHDLGKINFKFQKEVFDNKEKEFDEENRQYKNEEWKLILDFFDNHKNIDIKDHEIASIVYSLIFLDGNEWDEKIRTSILLHHYNDFYVNRNSINARYLFDDYPDLGKYLEFLSKNKQNIEGLLKDLLEYMEKDDEFKNDSFIKDIFAELRRKMNYVRINEFKKCLDRNIGLSTKLRFFEIPNKEGKNFYDFFVFLGALRRCDYAASGNVKIEEIFNIADRMYNELTEKIKKKLEQNNLWQEKILNKMNGNNLVLIAPTGSGKTEFALLWAKNKGKKLIYTLPLRVALNDLYWRFNDKEENGGYFERDFLRILHSTSFIEYLKEEQKGQILDIETKQNSARLFSSPLILTTPDQVFLSSLKFYGFDKLVNVYPTSAIVIDEIQAYNPEMAAVILKTIETIQQLQGNILIITATFPPYFKEFINEDKGFQINDLEEESEDTKEQIKNYNRIRHKVKLTNGNLFEYKDKNLEINEESLTFISNKIADNKGKNILIIVNNVGKAIKLYKKLQEKTKELEIEKENLYLLHSRLIEKEKDWRINDKKNGIKEKLKDKGLILIATQIVEASVDVDFDVLITEISPVDSQIQRWGRIHRNRGNKENYSEKEPNIFIFDGLDRGTLAIYDKRVIEKTIEVLKKYENCFLDYKKERAIINEVFENKIKDKTLKEIYIDEINKNLEWLKYVSIEKRSEAQRIFRRIAGIHAVIPQLMTENGGEIERVFGEIIKDKNNWKLPWESTKVDCIVEKVKTQIIDEEIKKKVNKWKLLQIIYSYSFNLPIFSFKRHEYTMLEKGNFKGFFVLKIEEKDKESILDEIKQYGINKIGEKINIDNEEIEEIEGNNIID